MYSDQPRFKQQQWPPTFRQVRFSSCDYCSRRIIVLYPRRVMDQLLIPDQLLGRVFALNYIFRVICCHFSKSLLLYTSHNIYVESFVQYVRPIFNHQCQYCEAFLQLTHIRYVRSLHTLWYPKRQGIDICVTRVVRLANPRHYANPRQLV